MPIKLAWIEFCQGWKNFRIYLACLILGVSVMAAVNILSFAIDNSLSANAKSLLGGDFEVSIRGAIPQEETMKLLEESYGKISKVSTLRTMLHSSSESTLVEVKAVDPSYPLVGELGLNEEITKSEALQNRGLIVDALLLDKLNLSLGDTVNISGQEYVLRATIKYEPDRILQIFNFGPRVIMSQESLSKTGLINIHSLIEHSYRFLAKSDLKMDPNFASNLQKTLREKYADFKWKVRTNDSGSKNVSKYINQLFSFLTVVSLTTFLIAGVGISAAIRNFLQKKYCDIAILKTLGANKELIIKSLLILIAILSTLGGVAGVLIATILVYGISPALVDILPTLQIGSKDVAIATSLSMIYGILISYIFAIPSFITAADIKISTLFYAKSNLPKLSAKRKANRYIYPLILILFFLLLSNTADKLTLVISLIIALISFKIFLLLIEFVEKISKFIVTDKLWLRLALHNISKPNSNSSIIILAIGISLTIFLTIKISEANFARQINKTINERAPSLFMIDIQENQSLEFNKLLNKYATAEDLMMMPMLRGRITKIADVPVEKAKISQDVSWITNSDRGISFTNKKPKNAILSEGKWWPENYSGIPLISVDERMLKGMKLKIGDTITLNILGEEIKVKIANAREINYTSFQINFAMLLSENSVDGFPHTNIATIFLNNSKEEALLVREIGQHFPNVTTIRTKELLAVVRTNLTNIIISLKFISLISFVAGLLVLASTLNASLKERSYDIAILKIMGIRKQETLKLCFIEWSLLALIASVVSVLIGTFSAYLLSFKFRILTFSFEPAIISLCVISCLAITCLVAYFASKRIFNISPGKILRNN